MTDNHSFTRKDNVSVEKRSFIMSKIKSRDTQPELILRSQLWGMGARYRVALASLPGKPDIVFIKAKLAIFIDGAFWHGKKLSHERLSEMTDYWKNKIRRNSERDENNNRILASMGYLVLRFDEKDIRKHYPKIAQEIIRDVQLRNNIHSKRSSQQN